MVGRQERLGLEPTRTEGACSLHYLTYGLGQETFANGWMV
jgi:hypothetical protein